MKISWKQPALQSLFKLDMWREENGWTAVSEHLVGVIENYFVSQDLSVYVPGKIVAVKGMELPLRMVLISLGKSNPYKVFYRLEEQRINIFLVRHPYQKSLLK